MDRETFYREIIAQPNGHYRFVAQMDNLNRKQDGEYDKTQADKMTIWVPSSPFEEFNLVLSLCNDGLHRITLDLDFYAPARLQRIGNSEYWALLPDPKDDDDDGDFGYDSGIRTFKLGDDLRFVKSTNNWHGYGSTPLTWEEMTHFSNIDRVYYHASVTKGFFALRPPWVQKPAPKDEKGDTKGEAPPGGKSLKELLEEEGETF